MEYNTMSELYFISDTHIGHRGILTYEQEKRPFTTVEEMNEYLVQEWNKVVKPEDKVIHCGDFCFGSANIEYAARLNGRKLLVLGNHDTYPNEKYLRYFYKLVGCLQYENLIITHIPVHIAQLKHRFWANVHGHLHSKVVEGEGRYVNVSCEQLPNLAPIPYEEVINRATEVAGI